LGEYVSINADWYNAQAVVHPIALDAQGTGLAASIAVGTLIAERPPHRTVRAEFPHTAPT